eukprot:1157969-Pelagomonas_calceolata.AAC.13
MKHVVLLSLGFRAYKHAGFKYYVYGKLPNMRGRKEGQQLKGVELEDPAHSSQVRPIGLLLQCEAGSWQHHAVCLTHGSIMLCVWIMAASCCVLKSRQHHAVCLDHGSNVQCGWIMVIPCGSITPAAQSKACEEICVPAP